MIFAIQFTHAPLLSFIEGDKRLFARAEDWAVLINGDVLTLPAGGKTDLASIPGIFQNLLQNDDPKILEPAILHDYLCDLKGDIWPDHRCIYTSEQAAEILRDAMTACGASVEVREIVFFAVRNFGPQWT